MGDILTAFMGIVDIASAVIIFFTPLGWLEFIKWILIPTLVIKGLASFV